MNESRNPDASGLPGQVPDTCGCPTGVGAGNRPTPPSPVEATGGWLKTLWSACCGPAAGGTPQSPQSRCEPKEPTHEP